MANNADTVDKQQDTVDKQQDTADKPQDTVDTGLTPMLFVSCGVSVTEA